MSSNVCRVYLPTLSGASSDGVSYLVGWNSQRALTACVAAIVHGQRLEHIESALAQLESSEGWAELTRHCGGAPAVIGEWRDAVQAAPPPALEQTRQRSPFWLCMGPREQAPQLQGLWCHGVRFKVTCEVILYPRCTGWCFLTEVSPAYEGACEDLVSAAPTELGCVLPQMNSAAEAAAFISAALNSEARADSTVNRRGLVLSMVGASSEVAGRRLAGDWNSQFVRRAQVRCRQLSRMCDAWEQAGDPQLPRSCRAVARLRACEVCTRAMVDHALGGLLASGMMLMPGLLLRGMHQQGTLSWLHTEALSSSVSWLMDSPAGLKANLHLAQCIGLMFKTAIDLWDFHVSTQLTLLEPYIVMLIGFAGGVLGCSGAMALVSDLLQVITVHVEIMYLSLLSPLCQMLVVLGSMWRLFRGKKKNTLRDGRLDTFNYDMEQLLLGTLVFTVLVFLAPTVFAFYGYFSLVHTLLLVTQLVLGSVCVCVDRFPLFSLLTVALKPDQLPGSVAFEVTSFAQLPTTRHQEFGARRPSHTTVLQLLSCPVQSAALLAPLVRGLAELWGQLSVGRVLGLLVSGAPITVLLTGTPMPLLVHLLGS
eukprot:TRINITY_DN6945_c0_g1_i1.p1 TRINITY_DN6945_c0_g1~~TRINITY_DN6945_c0_g1_i1.p1  ORF type:complete len:593 (-),score=152.68 TRINITY_DN6945_c0_g1_i1:320-2098(-)